MLFIRRKLIFRQMNFHFPHAILFLTLLLNDNIHFIQIISLKWALTLLNRCAFEPLSP